MYENYKQMDDAGKASVKAAHKAVRSQASTRAGNLAWGYMRGVPYRRLERTTRTQKLGDGTVIVHNQPDLLAVAYVLVEAVPALKETWFKGYTLAKDCPLFAWYKDPSGAIPVPVRVKKPYVRPAEVA